MALPVLLILERDAPESSRRRCKHELTLLQARQLGVDHRKYVFRCYLLG